MCSFLPAHDANGFPSTISFTCIRDGPLQPPEIARLFLRSAFRFLRRDAQRVRYRQPHAAAAVIDSQDASGTSTRRYTSSRILPWCMATNRIIPPAPRNNLMPEEAPDSQLAKKIWSKNTSASSTPRLRAARWRQIVVAARHFGDFYVAKLILITLLVSVLFAFMLEPVVNLLEKDSPARAAERSCPSC